jgi:hypothetical protein
MILAGVSNSAAIAYQACGKKRVLVYDSREPSTVRLVPTCCKSRWCDRCAASRAARIRKNIDGSPIAGACRLITLTQKHSRTALTDQIDRLLKTFKKLRQTANWTERVRGGAYFLELTHNPDTKTWHPHLHILATGTYYDHADLKRDWMRVNGSEIVHVSYVRSTAAVKNYVTKYLTKPLQHSDDLPNAKLVEAIRAIHSRRLVDTFGEWRGFRLLKKPDTSTRQVLGDLWDLKDFARKGSALAARILQLWENRPLDATSLTIGLDFDEVQHLLDIFAPLAQDRRLDAQRAAERRHDGPDDQSDDDYDAPPF